MTMPTRIRTGGARTLTLSGAQSPPHDSRRRPISTPSEQLERLSDQFDRLIYDVRLGAKSQRQHDEHVHRAEAIAAGIRAVFRGKATPSHDTPPVHPPLHQNGSQAWW